MDRTARRPAAVTVYAATNALTAPLAHVRSTAKTSVAISASNGNGMNSGSSDSFSGFMDGHIQGRNVMTLGWLYIRPMDPAVPLATTTSVLGLDTCQSPGTGVKVNNANMLSLTSTYFFNNNIAGTFVGGVPPRFNLYDSGNVIVPVPVVGPLTLINLGLPQNDPVAIVREWSPTVVTQYYFSTKESKLRPLVGVGVSYDFFTNLELSQNFVNDLQNLR